MKGFVSALLTVVFIAGHMALANAQPEHTETRGDIVNFWEQ